MTPPRSPRFVGRTAELQALRSAWDEARAGTPVTVLIGGEAGVGKSRLINEFAAEVAADGGRVVSGRCVDVGGDGLAFAPIADVLRQLLEQIGPDELLTLAGAGHSALAGLLPELGIAPPTEFRDGPGHVYEVVTVLLERLGSTAGLLVIAEDLHWADRSTRDLLRFAVRALGGTNVLIVGTYRTDELSRTHPLRPLLAELDRVRAVRRVDVPRLSPDEVRTQLAGIRGATPPASVAAAVFRRSEGVPFLVEQLAELDSGDTRLPASLRELLLVKVEELSEPAQHLVRALAVGRDQVDHDLITAVSGSDAPVLDLALREAVSAHVLRVDGDAYCFQHALVREAVHADLLPGEHARLHARYAATLEHAPERARATCVAAEIAHHWYCAHELDKSFHASLQAADEAQATAAFGEMLRALERALELWPRVPAAVETTNADHAAVLARTSGAASRAGEPERALALIEAAVAEVDETAEPLRLAELLASQAELTKELRRIDSLQIIHRALALVPVEPPSELLARLRTMLGSRLLMDGRVSEVVDVSRDAAELAHATGSTEVEFRANVVLGPALIQTGRLDDGFTALRTARDLAGDSAELLVLYHVNASDALYLLGRYDEAAAMACEGLDRAAEAGLARSLGAMLAGNAAEPLLALGQWDAAEAMITWGIELDPPSRHVWQLLRLHAWLRLWRGESKAALSPLRRAGGLVAGHRAGPQYEVPQARVAAEFALSAGDHVEAWRHVLGVLDAPIAPLHEPPVLAAGGWALELRAREHGESAVGGDADRLRARMTGVGEWVPAAAWRAALHAHLAGVTGPDPAAWRDVVAAVDAGGGPAHLGVYARYRHSEALRELGRDRTGADDAAWYADELGAGLVRTWIDAKDAATRAVDGHAPTLTERERAVLRLLVAGRSNRQIGAELVISAKTASVHVSNILTKLQVPNRVEAAAFARRSGLIDADTDAHADAAKSH